LFRFCLSIVDDAFVGKKEKRKKNSLILKIVGKMFCVQFNQ